MSNIDKLTVGEIKYWRHRRNQINSIKEFKLLGRELAEKHLLTDREAIDVLNLDIFNKQS